MDVHDKKTRSHNMSQIRASDTRPEKDLRLALWKKGHRYRLRSELFGKPDLIFSVSRTVIFVDGCFWHRCPIHYREPASNMKFWSEKIDKNVRRDRKVTSYLRKEGWKVERIWEHEIKKSLKKTADRLSKKINDRRKCVFQADRK